MSQDAPHDDPDAVLLSHYDYDHDEWMRQFIVWLIADSGPDDWHRVLPGWNWDSAEEVPNWIIRQPQCDKATALLTFWMAQPDYYLQDPADRHSAACHKTEGLELLDEIRSRWRAGFYTRGEIAFDLTGRDSDFLPDFAALEAEFGDRVAIEMPLDMRGPLHGREVNDEGMIEGIPARFWSEDLQ